MRQRFKIFDSDTHLSPNAETLEPYFDANMREAAARVGEL